MPFSAHSSSRSRRRAWSILAGADDDAVHRALGGEDGQRFVAAEDRITLHAVPLFGGVVVDEAQDAIVGVSAGQELVQHDRAAIAGAVDDQPIATRRRRTNSLIRRNDARDPPSASIRIAA